MKPITTITELGEMEALIRRSERLVIAKFIKAQREDDTDHPRVQVFDVLARLIENGRHWDDRRQDAEIAEILKDLQW